MAFCLVKLKVHPILSLPGYMSEILCYDIHRSANSEGFKSNIQQKKEGQRIGELRNSVYLLGIITCGKPHG